MINCSLEDRMKHFYENVSNVRLMRWTPVAIRIDGKCFHTFTENFARPFDQVLVKAMQQTTQYLCENILGCVLGYTQSDEITLILVDYQKLTSDAWFDYRVQKLCSVSASMATMAFNRAFEKLVDEERFAFTEERFSDGSYNPDYKNKELRELWHTHRRAVKQGAMFDARCFNLPKEEVTNLIYSRQSDASRNSIQMVGQAYFSPAELKCKSNSDIQDMLMESYNINWNDYPVFLKRGTCVVRNESGWHIDENIPIFKAEGRNYIEKLINFNNEENDKK